MEFSELHPSRLTYRGQYEHRILAPLL